jgi:hypothetical protein
MPSLIRDKTGGLKKPMRNVIASKVLAGLLIVSACQEPTATADIASLDEVIAAIRESPPRSRREAEALIGAHLSNGPHTQSTHIYERSGITVRGIPVGYVEFREPDDRRQSALLSLTVRDVCLDRREIIDRYGRTTLVQLCDSHCSPDSDMVYAQEERWGRLSFGFAGRSPECLHRVNAWVNGSG